jgi:phosphatidylinositol alpha-1,6-mannosyltransferase
MPDTQANAASGSRVLLVTRNLPPLVGGMEKLNLHIALELRKQFEVVVVGPAGCAAYLPGLVAREVPHRPLWRFLPRALMECMRIARWLRPGWIVAGSGLTAPLAFLAARTCGARAVVYVHGLDLVVRHPVYRMLWHPVLRQMDVCLANSRNTAQLAVSIGVPNERVFVLHPGVDMPPPENRAAVLQFRERFGLGTRKILLSVGRLTARKGLLEFVAKALPVVTGAHPDVILVIVGNEAPDAIAGAGRGIAARIVEQARRHGLEHNVRLLGQCDENTLAAAYHAAAAFIFPTLDLGGDVEGFGLVALEAASYGVPTIAFSVGGVPDAVEPGRSGYLYRPGDYDGLADGVIRVLTTPRDAASVHDCRSFAAAFSWSRFGEMLTSCILRGSALAHQVYDDDKAS